MPDAHADASLRHLLLPAWFTMRARLVRGERGRHLRAALLAGVAAVFWMLIFGVLHRLLTYFRGVEEIGALLAEKLLGVILLGFTSVLLLSAVITSLSSFFLAKDLDVLVAAPVDWLRFYGAKLLETIVASSWMVALVAIPLFTAFGIAYNGGWWFPLLAIAVMVPMFVIPAAIGSACTLVLVTLFPARRTRDVLGVMSIFVAGGIVLFLRLARPEQLARPEGFASLIQFITVLRTPTSPFLPSEWVAEATMGFLQGRFDWLPLYLLWSTAGAMVVLGAMLHRWRFHTGFTNAQEGVQRSERSVGRLTATLHVLLRPLGVRRRELVLKELRVFFRDTTQWSQLILLAVLVVVYVYNIKFLPLRGEGMTFFLVNAVPFLNLVLAGFVLASIAARFLFPGVSLEGRTLWLLRASPIAARDLLWAKFWVGTLPLLLLALAIVTVTNRMLEVSAFMSFVSIGSITLLTFALSGMALGFGALFPQFDTANPAQIPTSFGGLLYMMSAIAVIAIVIVLEAGPVYRYLAAQAFRVPIAPTDMFWGFGWAALICIVATLVPIRLAITRLESIER